MTSELTLVETELTARGAQFTPLGLDMPDDLPLDGWTEVGRRLVRMEQVTQWWLGDWAAFALRQYEGCEEFGGKKCQRDEHGQGTRLGTLKEFAAGQGVNYQTLRDLAWVSRAVPVSRRRDNLEHSKHREVAALSPRDQVKWLDKMEHEQLPRSVVREQIRISQGESNALVPDGPVTKFITKALDDLLAWLRARPEGFWTEDHRQIWRDRLKPLVDFYQEL